MHSLVGVVVVVVAVVVVSAVVVVVGAAAAAVVVVVMATIKDFPFFRATFTHDIRHTALLFIV